jgi:hypothetical protein
MKRVSIKKIKSWNWITRWESGLVKLLKNNQIVNNFYLIGFYLKFADKEFISEKLKYNFSSFTALIS